MTDFTPTQEKDIRSLASSVFSRYRKQMLVGFVILVGGIGYAVGDVANIATANCDNINKLQKSLVGLLQRGREVNKQGLGAAANLSPAQRAFIEQQYVEWINQVGNARCADS